MAWEVEHRVRHRITCPLLVLWSSSGALPRLYGEVLAVWRPWATDVRGSGVDAGHFRAEDQPDDVADRLGGLLGLAVGA
jgi:haloacetate dehalogenase